MWVPVSSTGKVSCCRVRDLGSNPAYTKNQLVSWPDVDQIKSAALDQIQIQQIKSLSLPSASLPSANSDSVSYSPSELRIFGVTDDLRDFVKGLTSTTFQNFPIKGEQWITELARRTLSVCDNL
uniref:Uncharacterized protein n=1 Tax=Fagus sylvatica TaxID=28930 RepID=A0A2N9IKR3_FAGSY